MSRRFRGSRRQVFGIADDTTPVEEMALLLSASNKRNQELCAENTQLRDRLKASEQRLKDTARLLTSTKEELAKAEQSLAETSMRATDLELAAIADARALDKERRHTAGDCSHAAELKVKNRQASALEARVAELQRINEGYEPRGWLPPGTVRAALPATEPRIALPWKRT